ncbi:MAG: hypothetical protein K8T26_10510 [Lentisphaerae bacterium]|nr:hypothetical protein [Lentisphaerota bacterium]
MKTAAPRQLAAFALLAALLLGLPLLGVSLAGRPVARYLEFPPLTHYVTHAPFAWPAFIALALGILAVVLPFDLHAWRHRRRLPSAPPRDHRLPATDHLPSPFPWWGHAGLALTLIAWAFAWTRFPWFAPHQPFTFSPLWFGYILMVNAWTWRRTGRCMLLNRPRYLLALFPASAAFWWFFEYLNRFVQNWYYVGCEHLTPVQYALFATLPFSTVLPAVLGTADLLDSCPRVGAGLDRFRPLALRHPRRWAAAWLLVAVAGLTGIGLWPDYLFPLLWIAPLILITASQAWRGRPTLFAPIAQGHWQHLYRLAAAALICGFFWEMWNLQSAAKWIYAVPFVHRFQLFEMPLLGFAGYLPFGLECAVVGEAVRNWLEGQQPERNTPHAHQPS